MSVGATIQKTSALQASQASTPISIYQSTTTPAFFGAPSITSDSTNDSKNTEKPTNNLPQGFLKLGLDAFFSGVVMYITYLGCGLRIISGRGKKINSAIQKILSEKGLTTERKRFEDTIGQLTIMGPHSQRAFHDYWGFVKEYEPELINKGFTEKQVENHTLRNKTYRKLEAGLLISFISWARTVFFASNANWNNLSFFSPQALLAAGLPLVANTGYWYVYDKHLAGQAPKILGFLNLTAANLNHILDALKAFLKGSKRFISTDNLVKDLTFLSALVLTAYGVRRFRNKLEDPILNRVFKTENFGPKNLKEAFLACAIRTGLKLAADTSAFAGIIGALTILINQIFPNDERRTGFSHLNFKQGPNGLTTQQYSNATA